MTSESVEPELLTARGAAELLSVAKPTFYRYVRCGTFPRPIYIGGGERLPRWRVSEIRALIEQRATDSARLSGVA